MSPAGLLDARTYRAACVTVRTVCEVAAEGEPPVLSLAATVAGFWSDVINDSRLVTLHRGADLTITEST